jgi:hypothetical protein
VRRDEFRGRMERAEAFDECGPLRIGMRDGGTLDATVVSDDVEERVRSESFGDETDHVVERPLVVDRLRESQRCVE